MTYKGFLTTKQGNNDSCFYCMLCQNMKITKIVKFPSILSPS